MSSCPFSLSSSTGPAIAAPISNSPITYNPKKLTNLPIPIMTIVGSHLSIPDCAAMNCSSKELRDRAEVCAWKPVAMLRGATADSIKSYGSGKKAIEQDIREDVLAYYKFYFLANPYCGFIR